MRVAKLVSILALSVKIAYADADSIVAAINKISNTTATLGGTVLAYNGHLYDLVSIEMQTIAVARSIKDGTATAAKSGNLSLEDAFVVKGAAEDMVVNVNATMDALIEFEPQFRKAMAKPVVYMHMSSLRKLSAKFTTVVVAISPDFGKSIAEELGKQIDEAFQSAINVYKPY